MSALRPGGRALTGRLLHRAGLPTGAAVLDLGCGAGEGVALLAELGYRPIGLDCDGARLEQARARCPGVPLLLGDGACPPLPDGSVDGILMECVLSLLSPGMALAACHRLLRPGGVLLISDVYAGREARDGSPRLDTEELLRTQLQRAGFTTVRFEDCGGMLKQFLAQALMDGTSCCDWRCADWKGAGAGYCLIWARREE